MKTVPLVLLIGIVLCETLAESRQSEHRQGYPIRNSNHSPSNYGSYSSRGRQPNPLLKKDGTSKVVGGLGLAGIGLTTDNNGLVNAGELWTESSANKYCRNSDVTTDVVSQAGCQALCEGVMECVGISYSHKYLRSVCYLCKDDTLTTAEYEYGFYRRQAPKILLKGSLPECKNDWPMWKCEQGHTKLKNLETGIFENFRRDCNKTFKEWIDGMKKEMNCEIPSSINTSTLTIKNPVCQNIGPIENCNYIFKGLTNQNDNTDFEKYCKRTIIEWIEELGKDVKCTLERCALPKCNLIFI